jgi:hypothetical protein
MKTIRILFLVLFFAAHVNIHSQSKLTYKSALERSVTYLSNYITSDTCDYNIAFLAEYLSHKYDRNDFNFEIHNVPMRFKDNSMAYNFYWPIIGMQNKFPDDSLYYYYENTADLEHIMLWGANANKLRLDSVAKYELRRNTEGVLNIRNVYHVVLAIYWGSPKMDRADYRFVMPYKKKYFGILVEKLKHIDSANDDFMEGILGIICLNKTSQIDKEWISLILNNQNKDGGWAWEPNINKGSHPHSTILAYWILLELLS